MRTLISRSGFAVMIALIAAVPCGALAQATGATSTDPNAGVAAAVQSYFADTPAMIAIAKCESGPRQFMANGTPLHGGTGTMVGIFQLDATIHYTKALALGFDINTVAGNMGYARYLYGAEGTEPWISSFPCWGPLINSATGTTTTTVPPTATGTTMLTIDLSLGQIDPQVLTLQQLLNKTGFMVALSGPGSPGNETTKFGALTWAALKSFQCAKGIACSGEEATTGYGFLNGQTRAALLNVAASSTSSTPTTATSTASTTQPTSTPIPTPTALPPPTTATTTIPVTGTIENAAEVAELESRIAALLAILAQLQAQIATQVTRH